LRQQHKNSITRQRLGILKKARKNNQRKKTERMADNKKEKKTKRHSYIRGHILLEI